MGSILTSIKKLLGIDEDYTHFDGDIILHINSVFMILSQLGVGPTSGFLITGKDEEWTDFIGDTTKIEAVKTYTYLKVRLLFDPPSNSSTMDAMNRMIDELEWRLNTQAESSPSNNTLPDIVVPDNGEIDADILALWNDLKKSIEDIEKRLDSMGDVKDGVSPIVELNPSDNGCIMTITDAQGSKSVEILNGKDGSDGANGKDGNDGYTPVKGEDYWTPEEISELLDPKADKTYVDKQILDMVSAVNNYLGTVDTIGAKVNTLETQLSGLEELLGGI